MAVAAWSRGERVSPEVLARALAASCRPRAAVYWADLVICALAGWAGFVTAGSSAAPMIRGLGFTVAVLALYRAVLFIHELAHLARGAVPGFLLAWDLLAGIPLLAPSLLYAGSHGDHHKKHIYGTAADPEYAPIAHWSLARLIGSSLALLLVPALLALRWGLLGPIGWAVPPLRRWLITHLSTLIINPAYERRAPKGRLAKRWWIEEIAAAAVVWAAAGAAASGVLPLHWLGLWYAVVATILMLNHLRTLGAHRYANEGGRMSEEEQIADSISLYGPVWLQPLTALLAPVGLRFHALHHWLPTLPYHALGRVHRALVHQLPGGATYASTEMPALVVALAALIQRAS
jgi:fatty acid desaturase